MTLTLDAHQHLATPETQFWACSCSQEFPFLNGKLQSHSTMTSVCRCMEEPYHWVFSVGHQSIHSQAEIRLPVFSLLLCMWQLFFMCPFPLAVLVLTVCSTSQTQTYLASARSTYLPMDGALSCFCSSHGLDQSRGLPVWSRSTCAGRD